ncbi:PilZ domain-containing protein [Pseudomonas sp. LRF_L74]|uniref:PilZ domain-containing protein n=1 Tax=Pseudomonas sp. LRF_L74 TaxID=3369422 RepID=UPI003F643E3A
MRHFLRHPSTMPIELSERKHAFLPRMRLHNISLGGIACHSSKGFRKGTAVQMRVPLLGQDASYPGVVAWCRKQTDEYLVGIAFVDEDALFRARMVEQICLIEQFRQEREQSSGTAVETETIAKEWIDLHAAGFYRDHPA